MIWFCSHWKWENTVNVLPNPLLVWRFCYFGLKFTKQQYSSLYAANVCFVNLWGWCLVLLITICLQEGKIVIWTLTYLSRSLCCVDCNNKQSPPFSPIFLLLISLLKHCLPKHDTIQYFCSIYFIDFGAGCLLQQRYTTLPRTLYLSIYMSLSWCFCIPFS